jgi:plasmid stability protein
VRPVNQTEHTMAGKMRGKEGSEAVLTFRLPRSLHDKLKEAAGGRSVSEEMRERLEASFAEREAVPDETTRQLLAAISAMADALASLDGPNASAGWPAGMIEAARGVGTVRWHVSPVGFASFRRAIEILLGVLKPGGESPPSSESTAETGAWVLAMVGAAKLGGDTSVRVVKSLLETRDIFPGGIVQKRTGPGQ